MTEVIVGVYPSGIAEVYNGGTIPTTAHVGISGYEGPSSAGAADQAWFWTPEWQAGEREAEREISAGRTTYFESDEEFLAALERETR